MIAEHSYDWYAKPQERCQHRLHLLRLSQVRKIASQNQEVCLISQTSHGIADAVVALRGEMKIGYGGDSHRVLTFDVVVLPSASPYMVKGASCRALPHQFRLL